MASTSAGTTTATGRDNPPPGIYRIDPTHSKVQFMVQHLMISRVRGHFNTFAGTIEVASEPERSHADATIEAASIDTGDENRDNHLRSADFLDVEHYPEIRWASTGIRRAGDGWEVDGDLTIRDMTKPVTLMVRYMGTATDPWGGTRVGFEATSELNRDDWGVNWNQLLEAGSFLVGKKVQVELDIEAVLQGPH
jgi:polyisoprenoid-binding protein YceI